MLETANLEVETYSSKNILTPKWKCRLVIYNLVVILCDCPDCVTFCLHECPLFIFIKIRSRLLLLIFTSTSQCNEMTGANRLPKRLYIKDASEEGQSRWGKSLLLHVAHPADFLIGPPCYLHSPWIRVLN
jgi:hypothetical protein